MRNDLVLRHSFANPMWWGWHRFIHWEHHRRLAGTTRGDDMNDTPWNDAGATTSPEPAPARPARQKRKPKAEAAPKVRKPRAVGKSPLYALGFGPSEPAAPAPKKPRKAKVERAAPETIKVSLKEYAHMRRIAPCADEFLKIYKILNGLSRTIRRELLVELQKVFG